MKWTIGRVLQFLFPEYQVIRVAREKGFYQRLEHNDGVSVGGTGYGTNTSQTAADPFSIPLASAQQAAAWQTEASTANLSSPSPHILELDQATAKQISESLLAQLKQRCETELQIWLVYDTSLVLACMGETEEKMEKLILDRLYRGLLQYQKRQHVPPYAMARFYSDGNTIRVEWTESTTEFQQTTTIAALLP